MREKVSNSGTEFVRRMAEFECVRRSQWRSGLPVRSERGYCLVRNSNSDSESQNHDQLNSTWFMPMNVGSSLRSQKSNASASTFGVHFWRPLLASTFGDHNNRDEAPLAPTRVAAGRAALSRSDRTQRVGLRDSDFRRWTVSLGLQTLDRVSNSKR